MREAPLYTPLRQWGPPGARRCVPLWLAWLLGLIMTADPSGRAFGTDFVLRTEQAGLATAQFESPPRIHMQPYMSGGAAAGDFNGDGWVDLYITRLDAHDLLYQNNGDGTFREISEQAFGSNHLADSMSNGVAWGDIDNDNDLDLYVTSLFSERYHLFVNQGDGTFVEQAIPRGADLLGDDLHFGFSPTFGDYDRDGYLDLVTTEWRIDSQARSAEGQNTRLLRNQGRDGPGHYIDVTDTAGVALDRLVPSQPEFDSQSFTARFTDLDGDRWPDLAIAGDHGTSRLFWNNGNGTFLDGTDAAQVGTDRYGMGSAVGDYDGDGDLDWFVTSIFESGHPQRDGNRLYQNQGDRTFVDVTDDKQLRDGGWGWGAAWFDYDHDGDLDLAQASGQAFPFLPHIAEGFNDGQVHFWRNDDGEFHEVSELLGLRDEGNGKGLLTLDYDRDGDLDLLVLRNGGAPSLWENQVGQSRQWLQIALIGSASNRQGIGALVTVDPNQDLVGDEMIREIDGGSHFLGQSPALAHFGLGETTFIDRIIIDWPSGYRQTLTNVGSSQQLVIEEPVPEPASLALALAAVSGLVATHRKR